jgi:predicted nucleic acid-binding protein
MPAIEIVTDANIALKWFHERGEEDIESARELLDRHRERRIVLHVLDLTFYEIGNALLRGATHASAQQTTTVLGSLRRICPVINSDPEDLARATELAAEHRLTLYDAAYAAVAQRRGMALVTLDRELLGARLGTRPADLLRQLNAIDI